MRILIVAATEPEIGKIAADARFSMYDCDQGTHISPELKTVYEHAEISTLITGVGMVATAFALGNHLVSHIYDLVVNLGIAGSFDRSIALGEVVEVVEDSFSELGAEDDEEFIAIDKLGFGESSFKPLARLYDHGITDIRQVTAITVNTVHGNEANIKTLTNRIQPQLESMEGAAFFYACKYAGVPCMQIRAVSNYVEKRNRDAWQIGLAIKNLNNFAVDLLKKL